MAQETNIFERSLTIPQFKAMNGTQKIFFNPMVEKGTKQPLFYKDSEGHLTNIQRHVATDDANNIIANVSMKVAKAYLEGKLPESLAVGARQYEAEENGQTVLRTGYTIYSPSEVNRVAVL